MNKWMRGVVHFAVIGGMAFAGGFAAQALLHPTTVQAQLVPEDVYKDSGNSSSPQIINQGPTNLAQNVLTLSDLKNRKGISAFVNDGQPGQIFYGDNGNIRIQLGTYTGAGERGLPLIALSDSGGNVRLLFRLAGDNQSPVMIMKDNSGKDRMVMGLGIGSGTNQEPFLAVTDKDGKRKMIFGEYK
ncbi:MAG: hypothetical protein GC185_06835 [Alphaproteobacteria bacterium]|nr:hypothetical protein [Alphaproteobacteria bacterium]